ncbi:hypothetical protein Tco_0445645 [Tanacetum coccineum]
MSITNTNIHKSSETEDSTLPNQDTDEVPSNESQRNITNPLVVFSDSSATDYDSADESSVCSTPLLPLKKLDGVEPVSRPNTIKSILKSKSTFKAETLKGITINEPSSAPARGNSSLASKTNSAPASKLKNMKMEDNPPLAIVMKELNELKLQINKKKIFSLRRGINLRNPQHVTKNCETCGKNAESFKARKNESLSALRSKTPTKSKAVNEFRYRGMIGPLMNLTTRRLKIQFSLVSVQDIKQILRNPTLLLSREFSVLKKQQSVAMYSVETVNVAVAGCYANILWMKSQLTDFDIIYEKVPISCDNTSAIVISNNLVLHSRTKHIDIRYHFIRDHALKGDIELHFIPTQYQFTDIFTKPLDEPTFKRLIVELGMLNIDSKLEVSVLTEEN